MGICFSSKSCSFDSIRVVDMYGYVEDYYEAVTVKEITANYPKHYLCTMAQLFPNARQLRPETQLQPGLVYLILPCSFFESDTSPINMVSIGKRLTAIAHRTCSSNKVTPQKESIEAEEGASLFILSDELKASLKAYKEENTWKPILDSIIERSMEYRCESDLIDRSNLLSYRRSDFVIV